MICYFTHEFSQRPELFIDMSHEHFLFKDFSIDCETGISFVFRIYQVLYCFCSKANL